MDRFIIGREFPVHFLKERESDYRSVLLYWLSLHINSSGWLLCLNLAQSELKEWEFTSYTKFVHVCNTI